MSIRAVPWFSLRQVVAVISQDLPFPLCRNKLVCYTERRSCVLLVLLALLSLCLGGQLRLPPQRRVWASASGLPLGLLCCDSSYATCEDAGAAGLPTATCVILPVRWGQEKFLPDASLASVAAP